MRHTALVVAAFTVAAYAGTTPASPETAMVRKITPIINVEAIEPMLPFWEALGFARTAEVPLGDALGFVIMARDGFEVMYQTIASIEADVPSLVTSGRNTILFIEVDDVEAAAASVADYEVVVPRRETFYGSTEVWVRAPCGTVVGLAQMGEAGG